MEDQMRADQLLQLAESMQKTAAHLAEMAAALEAAMDQKAADALATLNRVRRAGRARADKEAPDVAQRRGRAAALATNGERLYLATSEFTPDSFVLVPGLDAWESTRFLQVIRSDGSDAGHLLFEAADVEPLRTRAAKGESGPEKRIIRGLRIALEAAGQAPPWMELLTPTHRRPDWGRQ